jgi:hypothetical protein
MSPFSTEKEVINPDYANRRDLTTETQRTQRKQIWVNLTMRTWIGWRIRRNALALRDFSVFSVPLW